jgi:hypothetical protein
MKGHQSLSWREEYCCVYPRQSQKCAQQAGWTGGALVIAAAVTLILCVGPWITYGRRDVMRWNGGGDLEETAAFKKEAHYPPHDRGRWQAGANDFQARGGSASQLDPQLPNFGLPRVSVYSVPNIRPAPANPTLKDLSERAQVRAIEAIEEAAGSKDTPWDDLRKTLSDTPDPGERDPFLFERVLVATVAKGVKWPPGDRMTWTRILVTPINFHFAAYTIAATENETVKISSVEATNVRKVSADIALAVPGADGSKVGVSPSSESSVKTTSDITAQYERLGVDIMPDFLRSIRESGAGGDVTGNTKVALNYD